MLNLLKWILFPGGQVVLRASGDDGGAGARAEEEEARKSALRARIDKLYGVPATERQLVEEPYTPTYTNSDGTEMEGAPSTRKVWRDVPTNDADVEAAQAALTAENKTLRQATRAYYTDKLGEDYEKAERNTRFKLARQGLRGGSEDVFQQGEVKEDRDLGATRIDEAVRRAVTGLKTQREQERLNAINLVNAGSGESAVSAAQAGLRNTFDTASNAQKADIFSDLFEGTADALAFNNAANMDQAMLERYRRSMSTFFPNSRSSSGSVTPR